MRRITLAIVGWSLAVTLSAGAARAEGPLCGERKTPCCVVRWWSKHSLEHTFDRAGHPEEISRRAGPSDTGRYVGYYVGGGSPCCGHYPGPDEGTWGWDYRGLFIPKRICLLWTHSKYQGGTGAYKTDGPQRPEREKKCE